MAAQNPALNPESDPRLPSVSVVVGTTGERVNLLWLLDSLQAQELELNLTAEVLIVHDAITGVIEAAGEHPLVQQGIARLISCEQRHVAVKRNLGWRAAQAELIAFTDDDCRPCPTWLSSLLDAAQKHPGALIQGATVIDRSQLEIAQRASLPRFQEFSTPSPWAEMCNLAVPREALQRVGGLDENYISAGEDTDLAWRLYESGSPWISAPEAVVEHAVATPGFMQTLRASRRFSETTRVARRHPGVRASMPLRLFWKPSHFWLLASYAGVTTAALKRDPVPLLLSLPFIVWHSTRYGRSAKGIARSLTEVPAHASIESSEIIGLAVGSVKSRSLLL